MEGPSPRWQRGGRVEVSGPQSPSGTCTVSVSPGQGQNDVLRSAPDPGVGALVGRAQEGWGRAHTLRRLRVESRPSQVLRSSRDRSPARKPSAWRRHHPGLPAPRLRRPHGEPNGAAQLPHARRVSLGGADSAPGLGRQTHLTPLDPLVRCWADCGQFWLLEGHPRYEGGSLIDIVPGRDQDNQQEGGPRVELFAQASALAAILATSF
ncbi:hypothetical protein NDU88_001079 [Pleurodeles waltl]|uniref:Uncharacterized protein n=1 Tax=Pleurodeles waltl TaxID=8319 RepID=A0AAV7VYT1_PLEWA|nr:hypothetical protein NDU88_001079 [Pleurodeles waltl]